MLFLFLWCQFIWFFFQNYLKRVIIVNRGVISLVWPIFFMFGQPKPKIWVLKFSKETNRNNWELISFGFISVLLSLKRKQENSEKWSVPIWGVGICNVKQRNLSEILQKKKPQQTKWYSHDIYQRQRKKREESYHERRRGRHVEWQWRLMYGGWRQMWTELG